MAGPDRDGVRHVQHLLRHVDDLRALSRNPFVKRILEANTGTMGAIGPRAALAQIRTKVLMAAKLLLTEQRESRRSLNAAKRQYEIIRRCDLGNELHRVVATELGLSQRQFYRERLRACTRLAEILAAEPAPLEANAYSVPSEFELRLDCAAALRNYGQLEAALAILNTVAADCVEPLGRIRAWCEVASVLCDAGRTTAACQALDSAWQAWSHLGHENQDICAAEIHHVMSAVEWARGGMRQAMAANDRALTVLHSNGALASHRGVEIAALVTMGLASQYREMGNNDGSLGLLQEARELVNRLPDPAPALCALLNGNIATTHALTTGGVSRALQELGPHLDFTRRHNLQRESVDALSTLCLVYVQRRDFADALKYGRSALALARTISSAEEFAYCALNVSRIEALSGRGSAALNLIEEVRSRVEADGTISIFADMSEAEVLLRTGSFRRVVTLAGACAATFERLGMERYLGSSLRIQAEGLVALGQTRDAVSTIGTAIEVLERRGHAFSLAQAYEVSAKITGSRKHGSAATELFSILSA